MHPRHPRHPRDLVRPLEDDWRDTLDAVARAHGWPSSHEPAKLSVQLKALSLAYNTASDEAGSVREAAAARLVFSFARDVPKSAGAVRELVASGALALPPDRPLRVLDLGAGLGATTWGLARALEASGAQGAIEAIWVDLDPEALAVAGQIATARARRPGPVTVTARAVRGEANLAAARGARFDVVLLGQVLSELEGATPPNSGPGQRLPLARREQRQNVGDDVGGRLARHVELVRGLLQGALEPHGSLVVIEPALRDRTRHLHALRDALLPMPAAPPDVGPDPPITVFAPCLHAAPCPALAQPGDWCHEDLAVDLPAWLVPIARGAGLRWQGLTFSYLVLRTDRRTLADTLPRAASRLRVVSGPLVSKGKREAFVCGELASEGAATVGRVRARRLDRDAGPGNAAWDELARGDLIAVDPPIEVLRPRIDKSGAVRTLDVPIDGEPRPR